MDSNHRRRKPADLQSAPFGHSGNHPCSIASAKVYILADTAKGLTNFFATNIVCAVAGMINRVWLKLFIPLYFDITEKTLIFAIAIADMAQLVEQRIRNAWVRGSSPRSGSKVGGSSPPSGSREKTKMAFSLCVLAELPKKPHTLYDGFRDTFS